MQSRNVTRLCRKRLIIVTRGDNKSSVRTDGARPKSFVFLLDLLREAKVPGAKYTAEPEFGQPLLSPEEAREYVEYFGGGEDWENTAKTLERTNDAKIPVLSEA